MFFLVLVSIALLVLGAGFAAWKAEAGLLLTLAASLLGGTGALGCLLGEPVSLPLPWALPLGSVHLGVDGLSAFFLLVLFLVLGLSSAHARRGFWNRSGLTRSGAALFNLLAVAMIGVLIARDGVLFLLAWEAMSLATFLLVSTEHIRPEVRRAGMVYLVASHLGAVFVMLLFALLARHAGSYDFDRFAAGVPKDVAGTCFLLALLGFGTKIGLWPLHVWIPDADAVAPAPVAAISSGIMKKLGYYGILRVAIWVGPAEPWWGKAMVAAGLVTGMVGVLQALGQTDGRRLLAYSTIENMGIVAMGLGVGMMGAAADLPAIAVIGVAGGLAHLLNHALFKTPLILGMGTVEGAVGHRDLDRLGGLLRRMPRVGAAMLVASVALMGVPLLNGFAGEWLIYSSAFRAAREPSLLVALAVIPGLGLVGGLAVAAFVRMFGVAFLGEPRSDEASMAAEPATGSLPLLIAAATCVGLGLAPIVLLALVAPAARLVTGGDVPADVVTALQRFMVLVGATLAATVLAGVFLRKQLQGRIVRQEPTWGCGYDAPSPRMQYTATSFGDPLLVPFEGLVRTRRTLEGPVGPFPSQGSLQVDVLDPAASQLLGPITARVRDLLGRVRRMQHGRIQIYLTYMLVTLIVLLVWQLGGRG